MLVTYRWLQEFVEITLPPREVAEALDLAGIEVARLQELDAGLEQVVVGQIRAIAPHPRADRLSLCDVDVGGECLHIVCGASNIHEGLHVPVALPGATLPNGLTISRSKIRGVTSEGMICSEAELRLGEDAQGIMHLPPAALGSPVARLLGLDDVILELEVTPNRPDVLSVMGVAREVAALAGGGFRLPPVTVTETGPAVETLAAVTIEDPAGCPRYSARVIQGVRIGPSPDWLQRRLQAVGVRPINNVVDATNYALMERGQPLHAFDFDRLEGRRIVVRRARPGEEFYTLDGQRRVLSGEALMICDAARAVALAGIMGGANSEIAPDTTAVLLESAYFDPITTRRTSKALGLRTEASQRFERGADPAGVVPALDRGAALICELAGGEIARGVVDVYPRPIVPRELRLRPGRVNALLGTALPAEEVRALLERLQLGTRPAGDGELRVTVPTFRPDLQEEVDLIEEVARLHGYQRIPEALPQGTAGPEPRDRGQLLRERVQTLLTGAGLHEAITFSFHAPRVFDQLRLAPDDPRRRCVRLLNPLSETQSVMRTLLVPGLLEAAGRNANRKNPTVRLFEVGKVFLPTVDGKLPQEVWTLGLLLMGLRQDELWDRERAALDFYDLKGTIELLLDGLDVRAVSARATEAIPYLHPGKAAELLAESEVVGVLGELHPEVLGAFDLKSPALVAEVNLEALAAHVSPRKGFTPLPRFPAVFRDFALVADEGLEAEAVCRAVLAGRHPLLQEVRPFDVYRGDPIPPGKKGLAFRIRYQAQDRTLTDEEVNGIHEQALARLRGELGAEIRQ